MYKFVQSRDVQICTVYESYVFQLACRFTLDHGVLKVRWMQIFQLCVGDLVAVNCENSREPAISSCTEIFEEDIEIVWMEGDYTSAWKIRDPKNKKNYRVEGQYSKIIFSLVWFYANNQPLPS